MEQIYDYLNRSSEALCDVLDDVGRELHPEERKKVSEAISYLFEAVSILINKRLGKE